MVVVSLLFFLTETLGLKPGHLFEFWVPMVTFKKENKQSKILVSVFHFSLLEALSHPSFITITTKTAKKK